jgi:RNA polymerase sigma-70 factor (family 1)
MTPKLQDNDWLVAFREGNSDAFKQVFKEFHQPLCYVGIKMGLDEAEAEDIVADTFGKLWQGRTGFNDAGHVKGFLYTTTRNACYNLLKQKQRRTVSATELTHLLPDHDDDFFRKMVEAELLKKLYPFIENLPRKCRAVVEQVFFEGASTEEAAERLGISTRNVLNQKARAIKLLQGKIFLISLIYCYMQIYHVHYSYNSSPVLHPQGKVKPRG